MRLALPLPQLHELFKFRMTRTAAATGAVAVFMASTTECFVLNCAGRTRTNPLHSTLDSADDTEFVLSGAVD